MSVFQPGEVVSPAEKALGEIMCDCHDNTPHQDGQSCAEIGEAKHACCEQAIQNHKPPPEIGGEQGYDGAGNALTQSRAALRASGGLKGTLWPDACAMSGGNPTQFFDFKFVCPKGGSYYDKQKGEVRFSGGSGTPGASFYMGQGRGKSQYQKYNELGQKLNPPTTDPPRPLESRACK